VGNSGTRARGEHVRRIASGRECNKAEKSGDIVIRSPEGQGGVNVRREPISKSCEITQADNLNRRRRLSRKAQ